MSEEAVFDLGEIDTEYQRSRRSAPAAASRETRPGSVAARPAGGAGGDPLMELGSTGAALFLPGTGQLLRAQFSLGLFYMAWIGFLGTLVWALLGTLDRLGPTLVLFGLPAAGGVWALGGVFILVAVLHVASVVGAIRDCASTGPVTAGIASGLVPGWGQALTGQRWSAALFLTGCWVVAASWILVSTPVRSLLDTQGLALPPALALLSSPVVRWALPAVIWTLAVYDAAVRAARPR